MIEAKNLTMYYGPTMALDRVSFEAREKEVVGLLGPNGAGKSTLMRILTTFIYPTQGTAHICGFDITKDPLSARKLIGYLPENPPLYVDMRVDEFIDFVGRARGLSGGKLRERKDWAVETTQIADVWKHPVSELSLGYRQRVGLAQALIHDPGVVILDEPTSGLDPMQIVGIRKLIRELAKDKTIIFSTHILQEASAVSDRLLIIDQGSIIAQGTVSELKMNKAGGHTFGIGIQANRQDVEEALKGLNCVKKFEFIESISSVSRFICSADSYEDASRAINRITREKDWFLRELTLIEPSLEDIFLGLFKTAGQAK
ncbi:MAG: ATP-binding cassette domain-containing protein [Candidatus Omnitrophica bacterium]|nr:ATP-binding cassette domain-containing protein [Candidatus Omnitrophota bacterium]